jgi:ABC-type oligopeptide transport system substrate-binding subunit
VKLSKSHIGVVLIIVISFSLISTAMVHGIPSENLFFKVRILVESNSDISNLANVLVQDLKKISIASVLNSQPEGAFEAAVLAREFDLVFIELNWPGLDVDPTNIFSDIGAANYWGLDTNLAFGSENEEYLMNGTLETEEEDRIEIYHDWQENLMDNLLPIIPLYNKITTYVSWDTLVGWDHEEGLIYSLPYMEWASAHYQQDSTDVFIDYTNEWFELNPLFVSDNFFASLISEPLIRINKNGNPEGVLAESWNYNTNKTKLTITLRDNIFWQPDFENIYEDEPLTTDDVLFSVTMYQNISTQGRYFKWIVDHEIEDDSTIHFYIDGDRDAPGLQPFAPAVYEFNKLILPEHYLNVSLDSNGLPDTSHINWGNFGSYGLGTGMYYFGNATEVDRNFFRNDEWWGTRADAFNDDLDIAEYRVRLMPDLTSAVLNFENGKLDIFKDYRKHMDEYLLSPYLPQTRSEYDVVYLGFNLKSTLTNEIADLVLTEDGTMSKGLAVRKAIAHVFNKEVITSLVDIETNPINSPLSDKFGSFIDPNITSYTFDLDQAKAYMTKAGFDPNTLPSANITFIGVFVTISLTAVLYLIRKKRNSK